MKTTLISCCLVLALAGQSCSPKTPRSRKAHPDLRLVAASTHAPAQGRP